MGYIKQQIRLLVKESGDKKRARAASEEWFNESVKSRKDKDVQLTPRPFKPGKIYVFDYVHPKWEKELDWFDKKPVVLALNPINETTDCGINLNLLPISFKENLLDAFYHAYEGVIESTETGSNRNDAMKQRPIMTLRYEHVKTYMEKFGFGFAVRAYKTNLKKNQTVVSYESWPRIALCDFIKIHGSNVWAVRRLFAKYYVINKSKF